MGFNRYGTPLLSMMSNERETNLLTLSPLPKGDILNSSKTTRFLSSTVTMCLCSAQSFSPTGPPVASQSFTPHALLPFSPAHPPRNHSHPPALRLLRNRLPGTRLFPFIDPDFGILHRDQQPEAVQGFPQH